MKIERTHNMNLVTEIMTAPGVWPWASDDRSGEPADFYMRRNPKWIHLLAREEQQVGGLVSFQALNKVEFEGHISPLPGFDGARAVKMANCALDWMWANTRALIIIGGVAASNRVAGRILCWSGMEQQGRRYPGQLRNGQWEPEIMYHIVRPDLKGAA